MIGKVSRIIYYTIKVINSFLEVFLEQPGLQTFIVVIFIHYTFIHYMYMKASEEADVEPQELRTN